MGILDGRRIILVGGAGFIGHNLALRLHEHGAKVDIIDHLQVNNLIWLSSTGDANVVNRDLYLKFVNQRFDLLRERDIALHVEDSRDYHRTGFLINRLKPDVLVHLAAVAHAGRSNKDPYSTFDHSLRTLENTLDISRGAIGRFVYFSSSMVYGNFQTDSVDEEQPLNPIGIYGALKLSGEKIVQAYNQVFNLPYTIVRPSALYGPRCISRRVIQIFVENALEGEPLQVDGDGQEKLDFTYIDDLAEGISLAIASPKAVNETFNLTYGESRSIAELVEILRKFFPKLSVQFVKRDALIPFRGTLKVDKAKKTFGYAPSHPLEVGIPKYIDWYKKTVSS